LDLMGGGKCYTGGYKKLYMKHKLVGAIMTEEGSVLWMHHMKRTFANLKQQFKFDSRIYPAIMTFLQFMMEKYAHEFNFRSRL
jgi:truncated hemoglobin YjbI